MKSVLFSLKAQKAKQAMALACIAAVTPSALATESETGRFAYQPVYSQEVHGGVGLIQMPTSRMNPEGEFSANYSDQDQYRFWSLSLQLFPWMETSVRYSDIRTLKYSSDPNFSGDQTLKDKGIDAKFRLWQESQWLPQVAVGFRDFGGTGLFESEFISASKRWRDVDLHLGLGFGYMGRRGNIQNPFCQVAEQFCIRPTGTAGTGGSIDFHKFFRGETSLFGGIEYQTPWRPLKLKLEYDGNNYQRDKAGVLAVDSPWNVGAVYRLNDNVDLQLNYQRGNTVGFNLSYRINFHEIRQTKIDTPVKELPAERPKAGEAYDRMNLAQELYSDAGFIPSEISQTDDSIVLKGYSYAYRDQDQFLERTGKVLASQLPDNIKQYHIVERAGGLDMVTTTIDADKFVQAARRDDIDATYQQSYQRQEPVASGEKLVMQLKQPGFYTDLNSYWNQSFGSPEQFYLYQVGVLATLGYSFSPAWSTEATMRADVFGNFDEFKFKVDSQNTGVPRVRTYVREYASNRVALENFYTLWKDQLATNWYAAAYAGVLETMYTGAGFEVLHRPIDSRLAIGVDVNYVKQRDWRSTFGVRDYSVMTGHVSAYWQPEWFDDVLLKFKAGRYLAGDKGVTFEFNRRFDSGIVVGAYATRTNLSAAQYGEGSFSKGFFITIPFDLMTIFPGKGSGSFPWTPISRDGGQPLNRPFQLQPFTDLRSPFVR